MSNKGMKILSEPKNKDLIKKFLNNPLGRHSLEVQRIADAIRELPISNKHVLIRRQRNMPFEVGRLTGQRGETIKIVDGLKFDTLLEAERAILITRLREYFGNDFLEQNNDKSQ